MFRGLKSCSHWNIYSNIIVHLIIKLEIFNLTTFICKSASLSCAVETTVGIDISSFCMISGIYNFIHIFCLYLLSMSQNYRVINENTSAYLILRSTYLLHISVLCLYNFLSTAILKTRTLNRIHQHRLNFTCVHKLLISAAAILTSLTPSSLLDMEHAIFATYG